MYAYKVKTTGAWKSITGSKRSAKQRQNWQNIIGNQLHMILIAISQRHHKYHNLTSHLNILQEFVPRHLSACIWYANIT